MTAITAKNTDSLPQGNEPDRTRLYLWYLIERGHVERYGFPLDLDQEHLERAKREFAVIVRANFCSYFLILASIMNFCRRENIPYGPGRGSVGGCYAAFLIGVHELDSLEWDLIFERFMTPDRVSYPDVDLDFSQVHRQKVIDFTRETYGQRGNVVLQVGAFQRAGARTTIDNVLAAMRLVDPTADSTAHALRACLPEGNITGGTKQSRELAWWLENGHGDRDKFRKIAESAGWIDDLLKLDGMYMGLTRHAAGVVILSPDDVKRMPQCSPDGKDMVTGFDMYDLDELGVLKYDYLGVRTLDVIADAHKAIGETGNTRDLMQLWAEHRDDREPYQMLCEGDTLGIFQMETDGYRRTLKQFKPEKFTHIAQLNALYRPGALDYVRESDGKNMVEVFIERRHGKEAARAPAPELTDLLRDTHGIFLYQEQTMKAVQILAGFDGKQADELRKGIGKKRKAIIDALKPAYFAGCKENDVDDAVAARVWENIMAAARYSWNKCLAADTKVWTLRGAIPVQDVKPDDIVVSMGEEWRFQKVSEIHDNGLAETLKVDLEDNSEIIGTPNHRLLTKEGYKCLNQISVGDELQVAHRSLPMKGVKSLAATMTSMTERHQIPGWIVVYDSPRDDVVHWQFVPSSTNLDFLHDTTNLTAESISFANLVFESIRPGEKGAWVTRSLSSPEISGFFRASKIRSQKISNGRPMETKAFREFGETTALLNIKSSQLHSNRWWDFIMSISFETVTREESTKSGRTGLQSQLFPNFCIRPALPMERDDCSLALFKLGQLLQATRVSKDESLGLPCNPPILSASRDRNRSRQSASALAEFWNVVHKDIVPQTTKVCKISSAGKRRVYDLEMPEDHNFVANGIISHNSHTIFYGTITWLTLWFKYHHPAAFYGALFNSYDQKKERLAEALAEARQRVTISPPNINVTETDFVSIPDENIIVFGLNGIKGMGESNRDMILEERASGLPFGSFEDFCQRLPSLPKDKKLALIRCGAFDELDDRAYLLAKCSKPGKGSKCKKCKGEGHINNDECPQCEGSGQASQIWTVAEHLNHNQKLKTPRPIPPIYELDFPTNAEMSAGEVQSIGFYISTAPLADIAKALSRVPKGNHIGGEIEKVYEKTDKRDQLYASVILLTPALTKQRVIIFASNWERLSWVEAGMQIVLRGRMDGNSFLADAAFASDDVRHFKKIILERDGQKTQEDFDGNIETVHDAEAAGYSVRFL